MKRFVFVLVFLLVVSFASARLFDRDVGNYTITTSYWNFSKGVLDANVISLAYEDKGKSCVVDIYYFRSSKSINSWELPAYFNTSGYSPEVMHGQAVLVNKTTDKVFWMYRGTVFSSDCGGDVVFLYLNDSPSELKLPEPVKVAAQDAGSKLTEEDFKQLETNKEAWIAANPEKSKEVLHDFVADERQVGPPQSIDLSGRIVGAIKGFFKRLFG